MSESAIRGVRVLRRGWRTVGFIAAVAVQAASQPASDSLALELARLEVRRGEESVARTTFLRRLIPRITFTASIGAQGVFFTEGESSLPLIFPKDAYRLTLSLSLSDLLSSREHEEALIDLERARIECAAIGTKQRESDEARHERARLLAIDISSAEAELRLTERLLAYQKLLFDRGEVKFDVLARAELQAIAARLRLGRLRTLSSGGMP
jgi:hypothetical protein